MRLVDVDLPVERDLPGDTLSVRRLHLLEEIARSSSGHSRRRRLLVALAAACIGVGMVASALGLRDEFSDLFAAKTAPVETGELTPETRALVNHFADGEAWQVRRLLTRGGISFYRIGIDNGMDCVTYERITPDGGRQRGPLDCMTPADLRGVGEGGRTLIWSATQTASASGTIQFVFGLAADDVARVDFVRPDRTVGIRATVDDHAFAFASSTADETELAAGGELVAYDASGHEVGRERLDPLHR